MPSPIYHQQTRSVEVATKITHHTREEQKYVKISKIVFIHMNLSL